MVTPEKRLNVGLVFRAPNLPPNRLFGRSTSVTGEHLSRLLELRGADLTSAKRNTGSMRIGGRDDFEDIDRTATPLW